jgi:hypothetical protein
VEKSAHPDASVMPRAGGSVMARAGGSVMRSATAKYAAGTRSPRVLRSAPSDGIVL